MSDRKAANLVDPLARLASVEAPEFLDQLVLEQARAILVEQRMLTGRAHSPRTEPQLRGSKHGATVVAALVARLTLPGLKSS